MMSFILKIPLLSMTALSVVILKSATVTAQTNDPCFGITDPTCGSIRYDIGYSSLAKRFAESNLTLPTGAGFSLGIIEPTRQGRSNPDTISWLPAPDSRFTILPEERLVNQSVFQTGGTFSSSTFDSGHAAAVSHAIFSQEIGLAPNIDTANFYHLDDFITRRLSPRASFFAQSPQSYSLTNERVFLNKVNNYSSVGNYNENNALVLRQFDWAIATEDTINVIAAGITSVAPPIFSSSYNGIYVGITQPITARTTNPIDPIYNGFRQRPDFVTPVRNTSRATAVATGATTLLMELAANAELSKTSVTDAGDTIQNAQTSEVIKAIQMAGADKRTDNSRENAFERNPDGSEKLDENGQRSFLIADITDYGALGLTDNGLDPRFGAGQLNIDESMKILAAGEQDSREDGGAETVKLSGFDYDEAFGNSTASSDHNSVASYLLPVLSEDKEFTLTTTWNLDVYGEDGLFENSLLYDIDVGLYRVTDGAEELINASTSSTANTENIWQLLSAGEQYEFRVNSTKNITALLWDYAIAWHARSIQTLDSPSPTSLTTASLNNVSVGAVPLPGAIWLMLSGIILLASGKVFKKKRCSIEQRLYYPS